MSNRDLATLPPEVTHMLRQMLLARRRVLLAEVADIEKMLAIGRFAGHETPLSESGAQSAGERAVDWMHPEVAASSDVTT